MINITDDPIHDFNAWDRECAEWEAKRPICCECGEHIQDEFAYYIDGEWICESCMDDHRREVESDG